MSHENDLQVVLTRIKLLEEERDETKGSIKLLEEETEASKRRNQLLEEDRDETKERIQLLEEEKEKSVERIQLLEDECDESTFRDTGTIHMIAINEINKIKHTSRSSSTKSWVLAIFSLCFVMIQSQALYMMIGEINNSCASHNDCYTGQYCNQGTSSMTAFCLPCEYVTLAVTDDDYYQDDYYWKSEMQWYQDTCNSNENITTLESVGQDVFFIGDNGEAVFDKESYGDSPWCLAWQHCKQDEMFSSEKDPDNVKEAYNTAENIDQCDHLALIKNKLTVSQMFVFIFVTIILLAQMNQDIEEAAIEEALLRKNATNNGTSPTFPALIVLVSLRFRRFVLPWAISMAVVSLTLTDDLSMKNVLLNVVALEFILHADSLLAKYCCWNTNDTSTAGRGPDDDIDIEASDCATINDPVVAWKDYSWLAPRVETVVLGVMMILTVLNVMAVVEGIHVLLDYLHGWSSFSCTRLADTLWFVASFGSLWTCIVHAFCYFFLNFGSVSQTYQEVLIPPEESISQEEQDDGDDDDEVSQSEPPKTDLLLKLILGTLFQSMASLCALYLYKVANTLVEMTYYGAIQIWKMHKEILINDIVRLIAFLIFYIALKFTQKSV